MILVKRTLPVFLEYRLFERTRHVPRTYRPAGDSTDRAWALPGPIVASSAWAPSPELVPLTQPPLAAMPPPDLGTEEVPGSGVLGPASTQYASAYPYLWWVRAEYLMWWVKNGPAPPPLVTSGPATAALPAVLGQPGTEVILGGRPINYPTSSGGRWTFGSWFDLHQHNGFEVTGLYLGQPTQTLTAASNPTGTPILGRPFTAVGIDPQQFPTLQNGPSVDYAAFPNRFAGNVNVTSHSHLCGLEVQYVHNWVPWKEFGWGSGVYRMDLLAGVRHLDLLEDLGVNQNSILLPDGVANFQAQPSSAPNALLVNDQFTTRNMFYGGEVGANRVRMGRLFLEPYRQGGRGRDQGDGDYQWSIHAPSARGDFAYRGALLANPNIVAGGLLATATNIGRYSRNEFTVVPELGINFGYQLHQQVRLFVGYTFVYWSNVVRPGNQIDTVVNVTQVPIHPTFGPLVSPAQPAPLLNETNFWAQGINFGLEFRF